MKPIDPDELRTAITRVQTHRLGQLVLRKLNKTLAGQPEVHPGRVALSVEGKVLMLSVPEILYCKSDGNYTRFHLTGDRKVLYTRNLKQAVKLVNHPAFERVHHS